VPCDPGWGRGRIFLGNGSVVWSTGEFNSDIRAPNSQYILMQALEPDGPPRGMV